ncbi:Crp/Fnr family transcriptional regulator [Amycolatopsis nivea]|uniref:Crp/Fnr family transcriptional regulator n=1 Tax=Amycolatopsis nivea TaxID=1644109 RepID=UPI000689A311|nr:Crp/Fnr family transcriptional regulator [Amycolatopsis nivea]
MALNDQSWPADSLLGRMSTRTREGILELGTTVTYRARQQIFRQGEESHRVLLLLDGLTKIVVHTELGRPVVLALRGRGDLLGELLERRHPANVVTCTPVLARSISGAQLQDFFQRNPDGWAAMAGRLNAQLHASDARRAEFIAYPASARVSQALAEIAAAHGVRTPDGWELQAALTQPEIASLAGVALATCEKALRRLRRSGLVRRRSRRIVVGDLARLTRFGLLERQNPSQYGICDPDVPHS